MRFVRAFIVGLLFGLLLAGCDIILEAPSGWRVTFRPSPVQPPAPTAPPIWPTNTPRPTSTPVATAAIDPTPTREVWNPTLPPPIARAARNNPELNQVINVRSCASTDCEIVAKIQPGETVELLLEEPVGGWIHVLVEREGEGLVPGWAVYEWRGDVWWEFVEG
jgi:hypothetical protein